MCWLRLVIEAIWESWEILTTRAVCWCLFMFVVLGDCGSWEIWVIRKTETTGAVCWLWLVIEKLGYLGNLGSLDDRAVCFLCLVIEAI